MFQSGFLHNFCVLIFKEQFSSLNVTILFLGWILAICKYFYIWFAWFKISHQRKRWLRKKSNHILPRTKSEKHLLCPRYLSGRRAGWGFVQTCQREPCVCRASSRAGPVTGSHLYSKQHSPMKGNRKEPIIVLQMLKVTRNIPIRWSHNTEPNYNNSSPVSLCLSSWPSFYIPKFPFKCCINLFYSNVKETFTVSFLPLSHVSCNY